METLFLVPVAGRVPLRLWLPVFCGDAVPIYLAQDLIPCESNPRCHPMWSEGSWHAPSFQSTFGVVIALVRLAQYIPQAVFSA